MSEAMLQVFKYGTGQEMYTELSEFPGRYCHPSQNDMTGADIVDISLHSEIFGKRKYPLWSFFVGKSPLTAWLHKDGDLWFAEIDDLNVLSEGTSPKEAIFYLEEDIRYFKNFYDEANKDQLTKYALQLQEKFAELVPQK
ncbi:MAG: hypothetical protein AB2826_20270 [Candidatus Thiodiazotropha sp.]